MKGASALWGSGVQCYDRFKKPVFALLFLAFAVCANAQQYRWVDDNGRVEYTDTPPPADAKSIQKKNLNAGPAGAPVQPYALQVALQRAPIKLYSTPDCGPSCADARKLLNQRGIPFTEISITDSTQLEEFKKVSGGTTVPVMLVGASVQRGFQAESYNSILDAAGYPAAGSLKPRDQAAPKPPAEPKTAAAEPQKAQK
jgi:glutaredoxin